MKVLLELNVLTDGEPDNLEGIIKSIVRKGITHSPLQGRSGVDVVVISVEIVQ